MLIECGMENAKREEMDEKEYEILRGNRDKILGLMSKGKMMARHRMALKVELDDIRKQLKNAHREQELKRRG